MKEYTLFIRQGVGSMYTLRTYKNINSAKLKLYEMIQLEEEKGRPYFVDNDFFRNSQNNYWIPSFKYFCIKERNVTEWKKYCEKQEKNIYNNIIYFKELQNR